MFVKCHLCGVKEAVVYQLHTSKALCRDCFINDILKRVELEIKKYNLIKSNERVLLAISGGKDSFTLLDVMSKIHSSSKLIALTLIEGIEGYNRADVLDFMKSKTRELGIDHIVLTLKEAVGASVDEFVKNMVLKNIKIPPCTYCGIARRRAINKVAREQGVDKVATAHVLDDEAQTYVMNILRGDTMRLVQVHPKGPWLSKLFIRKVKPLRKIYERETALYAYFHGYKFQERECPYITHIPTLRARVRDYLYRLELEKPGSLLRLVELLDEALSDYVKKYYELPELPHCKMCGEPTSYNREICKFCELLMSVGLIK